MVSFIWKILLTNMGQVFETKTTKYKSHMNIYIVLIGDFERNA